MYYVPMPMNKLFAWESAISWAIITMDRSIERAEELGISASYDHARKADLLELQSHLKDAIAQWRSGDVDFVSLPQAKETV